MTQIPFTDDDTGSELSSRLLSLAAALLVYGALSGVVRFWDVNGQVLLPAFRYALFAATPLVLAGILCALYRGERPTLAPAPFFWMLCVSLCTDWLCREFNLLQGPGIRGPVLLLSLCALFMIRGRSTAFLKVAAVGVPVVLLWAFFDAAEGRLLFSDDHPSMLFRLEMLKEHFPSIAFYNPMWNAGFDNRDFFATGVLNVFFIFSPLIYFADVIANYNLIIALLCFVVVPVAMYLAARVEDMPDPVPAIAALLSLCTSLLWYRWCLKYGAIGFVTAAALAPLNTVLAAKLISRGRTLGAGEAVLFVISMTLMLFWSLSGVMLLPLLLAGLLRIRGVLAKPHAIKVIAGLAVVNIPWMLLFLSVSSVGTFLSLSHHGAANRDAGLKAAAVADHDPHAISERSVRGGVKKFSPENVLKVTREAAGKMNPLIVFLALPGYCMLKRRSTRFYFSAVAVWLLLLGTVGASLKPQLELERALVVLGLLSVLPVAGVIGDALTRHRQCTAAVLCGVLFAGLFSVSGIVYGRSQEQYAFAEEVVGRLSKAIAEYGGPGRTVFSGFMLHDLSQGHIAPLALFSGKPLVASTPFHNIWWYTDVIPQSYRTRGEEGIEEFLDLRNATAVVSRERKWRKYFDKRPQRYTPVFRDAGFSLYQRAGTPSWFLEGTGELLEQRSDGIRVRVETNEAVLKFNYFPFLESSACTISPYEASDTIALIRISGCAPGTEVRIKARSAWTRMVTSRGAS